jgi:hypothetical protein
MAAHSAITLDTPVVAAQEQVSCDLADEAVVLNIRDGVYYGMDPVAARIWTLLQIPRTVSAMRDILVNEFDVETERCTRELVAFLEQLSACGLLERRQEAVSERP